MMNEIKKEIKRVFCLDPCVFISVRQPQSHFSLRRQQPPYQRLRLPPELSQRVCVRTRYSHKQRCHSGLSNTSSLVLIDTSHLILVSLRHLSFCSFLISLACFSTGPFVPTGAFISVIPYFTSYFSSICLFILIFHR